MFKCNALFKIFIKNICHCVLGMPIGEWIFFKLLKIQGIQNYKIWFKFEIFIIYQKICSKHLIVVLNFHVVFKILNIRIRPLEPNEYF